jgi:hypothetical protein
MRRPGRLIFLFALSPRRRLEDALKTLTMPIRENMHPEKNMENKKEKGREEKTRRNESPTHNQPTR